MRSALVAAILFGQCASALYAQDWRMSGHDPQRTRRQTARAAIADPTVLWSVPAGRPRSVEDMAVGDVDLDGHEELVFARSGRVWAQRFEGTVVWASEGVDAETIRGIGDLNGDGRPEVVATGASEVVVLNGMSGEVAWRTSGGGAVVPVTTDDGVQLFVGNAGCAAETGAGRLILFGATFEETSTTTFERAEDDDVCGVTVALGNVTGNEDTELVALQGERASIYDLASGTLLKQSDALGPLSPTSIALVVADVDADGVDEILIASDTSSSFVEPGRLVLLDADAEDVSTRWNLEVAPGGRHRFLRSPVADLVVGGPREVLTSFYDTHATRWMTIVLSGDALGPTPFLTLTDFAASGIVDLDSDGTSELLVVDAEGPLFPRFGVVRAVALDADSPESATEIWSIAGARFLEPSPAWGASSLAAQTSSRELALLVKDDNADAFADRVIRIDRDGESEGSRTIEGNALLVGYRVAPSGQLVLTEPDGVVDYLGGDQLALQNDADQDGTGDLRVLAGLVDVLVNHVDGAPIMVWSASGAQLGAFRALAAGAREPESLWRSREGSAGYAVFADSDSGRLVVPMRGADEVLRLDAVDGATGSAVASVDLSSETSVRVGSGLVPLLRTDGTTMVVNTWDTRTGDAWYQAVDFAGLTISVELGPGRSWLGSGDGPGSVFDFDEDGNEDLILTQGAAVNVLGGADGTSIASRSEFPGAEPFLGTVVVADLDRDSTIDVLRAGGYYQIARLDGSLSPNWTMDRSGPDREASLAAGVAGAALHFATSTRGSAILEVFSADDGALVGSSVLSDGEQYEDGAAAVADGKEPGSLRATAGVDEIDGADHGAFLVASSDGYLYAVRSDTAALMWSAYLGDRLGEPIVADVTGDDLCEVVVAAEGGWIHAVGGASLAAPAGVVDQEADVAGEDLDELSSSSVAGVRWESVVGSTAYEVRLVRDDRVVVLPWSAAGENLSWIREDLALQLGRFYRWGVRAVSTTGQLQVSREALTDGFVVIDDTPPTVAVSADPEVILPGDPSGTVTLHVEFADNVRLDFYSVTVRSAGGVVQRVAEAEPLGGVSRSVTTSWDGYNEGAELVPGGEYFVTAEITDGAGLAQTAEARVVVCREGEALAMECVSGDAGVSDVNEEGGPVSARGCGCRLRRPSEHAALDLVVLWGGVWFFRRRAGRRR